MKKLFDSISHRSSRLVTNKYSTSFSLGVKLLKPSIRQDIYNIYGFVRFADEIVDSFHDYDQRLLIDDFELEYYKAIKQGISLNPILNAFQETVNKYNIDDHLIQAFLNSMKSDLKNSTMNAEEYKKYIFGSADAVGLMCLKVFLKGDENEYEKLKPYAMSLGSAFQKVNFLRDLKNDTQDLHRMYFPNLQNHDLDETSKAEIVREILADFNNALIGIRKLPVNSRLGVFTAYYYYKNLLRKIEKTPASKIMQSRIRISNKRKLWLTAYSFVSYELNLI